MRKGEKACLASSVRTDILTWLQECAEDLKSADPLLRDAVLYGRDMIHDDLFDEEEKDKISRELATLQDEHDRVKDDIEDERNR